jgi:hypothetical protein
VLIFTNSPGRLRRGFGFWVKRNFFGGCGLAADKSIPGFSRLRSVLRRLAGHMRDADERVAMRALDLATGQAFITLQMLVAVGTRKLKVRHNPNLIQGTNLLAEEFPCQVQEDNGSGMIWSAEHCSA